tara:strand:- start:111 stop:473 length:363 start_codon:yes stop_codon:yes gene_type:complete
MFLRVCVFAKWFVTRFFFFFSPVHSTDSPPGKAFNAWADEMASTYGVRLCASVEDLGIEEGAKTIVLISGRTADNPRLLKEVIDAGASAGEAKKLSLFFLKHTLSLPPLFFKTRSLTLSP